MANRYMFQFLYGFEQRPVMLNGEFTQNGSTGTKATVTTQGVTLTADIQGSAGNAITIAFTGGGTAGAEVVTVKGTAISVQIQSGVSSITQVRTAINASTAAAALVVATGTSASTVATASAVPLATGTDTVFTIHGGKGFALAQLDTGLFQITCNDPYNAVLSINITTKSVTAADLKAQIKSISVPAGSPAVIQFWINAVATPTNLATTQGVSIAMVMRNSGS